MKDKCNKHLRTLRELLDECKDVYIPRHAVIKLPKDKENPESHIEKNNSSYTKNSRYHQQVSDHTWKARIQQACL